MHKSWTGILIAMLAVAMPECALAAIEVSTDPTSNMTCDAGVCTSTALDAVLNVNDLQNMLAGSDVTIQTANGAITIQVKAPLTWASTSRLTLEADYNVSFKAPVTVAGTAGLTIVTNENGTGGDLIFTDTGSVTFWDTHSSLIINGASYALVNSVVGLASAVAGNLSGFFAFAADYHASADGTYSHAPVTYLEGTFEGLGHKIENLTVSASDLAGFFGEVGTGALVRDIHLDNIAIRGTGKHGSAGGIAGGSYGTIMSSSVQGSINASGKYDGAGGVVGAVGGTGTVIGCSTGGTVSGRYTAGGIVGWNFGMVLRSHSDANVKGVNYAGGGIVGINDYGTVDQSFSTGSVTSRSAGGVVGDQRTGQISNTYATGAIAGHGSHQNRVAGGIASSVELGPITTSYSTAAVRAVDLVGGVIGVDNQGYYNGNQNLYWDLDTSGIDNPHQGAGSPRDDPGITGLTDDQLKSGLPTGFDPAIWGQKKSVNNGYPYLLANPPPK